MSILTRALCLSTLAFATAVPIASNAASVSYGFDCISNNAALSCAIGEAQLGVTISDVVGQPNQVTFTFTNVGAALSSITDVYFDDGTLLGIALITNGTGVNFTQGANPGNLPSANSASPPFVTTAGFSADSTSPTQPNGVNPGETLTILFNLISGQTYADTLVALALDPNLTGSLRIGIHVQGFANGESESFVNCCRRPPDPPVPLPAAAWLLLSGLGGLGLLGRRRKAA